MSTETQQHEFDIACENARRTEAYHDNALTALHDNFKPCCRLAYLFGRQIEQLRQQTMKVKTWNNARRKLKKNFEENGIVRCEKCGGTFALGFAHRLKRRFITTEAEMFTVALLCQMCHEKIEHSGHDAMYAEITRIIENRFQVHRYFSDSIEDSVSG